REVEHVVAIDVHTGLGDYGEDTLLVEPEDYPALRPIFGDRVNPSMAAKSPAYSVRGGIHSMIRQAAPTTIHCVCQEFGTFGAARVLRALREENRWQHYGKGSLEHPSKTALKDIFAPRDEAWQSSVLKKGRALLEQAYGSLTRS